MSETETPAKSPRSLRAGLFRGKKSKLEPQPWTLTCLCGQTLTGERTAAGQRTVCGHCDLPHFILPINPYPAPKRVRRTRRKKTSENSEPLLTQWREKLTLPSIPWRQLFATAVTTVTHFGRQRLLAIRKWFTPVRSALSGLALVILLASYLGVLQYQKQQALTILRLATSSATQALEEARWSDAAEQYQRAAQAITTLGRNDPFAREVLQKNRELQAIERLSALSLEEMLQEAAGKGITTGLWSDTFERHVKDRWLIMETWVQLREPADSNAAPDGTGGTVLLSQTLPLKGESLNIRWPEQLFAPLAQQQTEPQGGQQTAPSLHVLCAGQITSLERDANDPRQTWIINIQPQTAFLWCYEETTAPLGFELESPWTPNDSLKQVLTRQRQLNIGSPTSLGSTADSTEEE